MQLNVRGALVALALSLTALLTCSQAAPAAPAASNVSLTATDGAGLKKAVQALKGNVVVVNLWATWCQPCVEEFPDLVKLYDTYRSRNVTVVAVSVDEPADKATVAAFLKDQKATFPTFMGKTSNSEKLVAPIIKQWSGAIPTTLVFDKNGRQIGKPHAGMLSYEEFEARVKPLLK